MVKIIVNNYSQLPLNYGKIKVIKQIYPGNYHIMAVNYHSNFFYKIWSMVVNINTRVILTVENVGAAVNY
jgi:hypothetical protein